MVLNVIQVVPDVVIKQTVKLKVVHGQIQQQLEVLELVQKQNITVTRVVMIAKKENVFAVKALS